MPESMFGRPLQHLLPSHPPSRPVTPASHSAPVPPRFEDVRFNRIGKPPGLLSRISVPQPDHTSYHSPTPSPISTPPPTFPNDSASHPQLSSRPTLLQQLAGSDSTTTNTGSGWHAPSQSSGSLVSRIQMDVTPSNYPTSATTDTIGLPSSLQGADGSNALIPPVEVLPQAPDSSAPPTPASSAPALKQVAVHDALPSAPLMTAMTTRTVQFPATSVVLSDTAASDDTGPFPSFTVIDAMMQGLQHPPSAAAPTDSLVARQERLKTISAHLANLTSSLPPSLPNSSSPDPSSVARVNENTTPEQPSDSQHDSNLIVLRHPYAANQSSSQLELSVNDSLLDASDSSLAVVSSPVTLTQEYETHRRALTEALEILNSTLDTTRRAQVDGEHALAQRIRTFEEQRAVFEQRRRTEVTRLQQELQELRDKREELNAKETSLASLEKESRAREDARKVMLARRQAREEEIRAADVKRNQEVQEQIAAAVKELKEIESLKAQGQLGQSLETVSDDLPTEPRDGMNEDEKRTIKSRNALLSSIKNIRRGLTDGVQRLEQLNRTLRGLGVERKRRVAEEAERRGIVEEERLRAHAEAERDRQVQDQNLRQLEAEGKRREVENDREQARLLHEQQLHAEVQAHGLGCPATTSSQTSKHRSHLGEGTASQQQTTVDATRIRATREANSLSQETAEATEVDQDGTASASHRAVSASNAQLGSGHSQPASSSKRKKPVSGGVMLAPSTPKAGAKHLPPKLFGKTPSFMSSDQVGGNLPNFADPSLAASVFPEDGRRSSFPVQLASEFNRSLSANAHETPDPRSLFPRTPKSKTILDVTHGGNEELNIGPAPGVSPTQRNVNLRHLKRSRGRVDESDSGDRSVRMTNVKGEEIAHPLVKQEEQDTTRRLVPASPPTNPPASLPPRPAVIPPPRPRKPKRHDDAPEAHIQSPSYPPRSNELSVKREEASVTIDEQAPSQWSSGSKAMNTPAPAEIQNSLLLGSVHLEGHFTEPYVNAGERLTQDPSQKHVTPPISAIATSAHNPDGENASRKNRRSSDENRRASSRSSSRRSQDHYSPQPPTSRSAIASPTQPHPLIDSARPPNTSRAPRAEPIRVPSPVTGRKRPSEHDDNEYGHRARRQRGDHWLASDRDYRRVDSYRSPWERRNDSDEERRATHRIRSYPSDVPRATHDNGTYTSPSPEGLAAPSPRWEQPSRRSDNDDIYQRYPPSASGYRTVADQHRTDDTRVGQTHEPTVEGRMDAQSDPSLLARMTSSQHYPASINYRGRGRGEPGRGRGRSVGRGGPPLLDRITSGPSSLEDRLT